MQLTFSFFVELFYTVAIFPFSFYFLLLFFLSLLQLHYLLENAIEHSIPMNTVLLNPTIQKLSTALETIVCSPTYVKKPTKADSSPASPIVIAGFGCRVPTANNPLSFWKRLNGLANSPFTPVGEYSQGGTLVKRSRNVGLKEGSTVQVPVVSGVGMFDIDFFKLDQASADFLDPHVRLMLEGITLHVLDFFSPFSLLSLCVVPVLKDVLSNIFFLLSAQ
mgnify:CR=1 FL=1